MGGAKNCPETPRQKMIGMMYLVLTAMLALNVSTDVLNGFKLVDDSLNSSVEATENRNRDMMRIFASATEQNPEKNQEWYDKALELTAKSDSLFNYVYDFKYQIVKLADGEKADPELKKIEGVSNLDVTGQYALVQGNGKILREKIQAYKNYLIELSDSTHAAEFEALFATNEGKTADGTSIPWEDALFDGMPVGASITLLTKIQSDIRTAESEMIVYLQDATDASDLRVNKMEALVIPSSKYVIEGGKYSAQIVLAAVDTTQTPAYYIGANRIADNGIYEFTASGLGTRTYDGKVVVTGPDGTENVYTFSEEYTVGKPSVTISNQDLNIMYRGYDNKFNITVPGVVSNDKIFVNVTGANKRQDGNLWIIQPTKTSKEVVVAVQAELDGKIQDMGSQKFRVKELPKPEAYFTSGKYEYPSGANIPQSRLTSADAMLIASYGPEGLLEVEFNIVSFQTQTSRGIKTSSSNKFTKEQIADFSRLTKGALVTITNIRAKGPKGDTRVLSPVVLTLQ